MTKEVDSKLHFLLQHKRSLSCSDLKRILEYLGFYVRDGKRGGHKVFTHSKLKGFESGSFNCEHGKNPTIKPVYVQRIIRLIEANKEELNALMRGL